MTSNIPENPARRALYAAWARLLDTIIPPPDEDRLVAVGEVSRSAVPLVEESLADVGLTAVLSPVDHRVADTPGGPVEEGRFRVLVPARDAHLAEEVVAGS